MAPKKAIYLITPIILFITYIIFLKNSIIEIKINSKSNTESNQNYSEPSIFRDESFDYRVQKSKWVEEIKQLTKKHGTDKYDHEYYRLYGTHVSPIRYKKLNFIEIGLGCNMGYGPGKSVTLWREYLPNSRMSILEYDGGCAERFRSKVDKLYIGDQSDFKVLEEVGKGGPYDIIIDDGGHSRKQQVNSFVALFPHVKSGGIYILEDLFTSFIINRKDFNDQEESSFDILEQALKLFNDPATSGFGDAKLVVKANEKLAEIHPTIFSIDCYRHACVFVKK